MKIMGLTKAQTKILILLADGLNQREIADRLGLSYFTIRTQVGNINNRLNTNSSIQSVLKYLKYREEQNEKESNSIDSSGSDN